MITENWIMELDAAGFSFLMNESAVWDSPAGFSVKKAVRHAHDYVAETELTASGVFTPDNVGVIEFTNALAKMIQAAQVMDKFKKALFRQRTREESGLHPMEPQPLLTETMDGRTTELDDLFHGIIGMITETGELAEVLYNFLAAGDELDVTNVREEIGDNLWYMARLVKWADTTFPAEMKRNIAKLRLRHGSEGFDKGRDIERKLDDERALLEGGEPMEVKESIPDLHCPDCGADVDENCAGDVNNCPRLETGQYSKANEA